MKVAQDFEARRGKIPKENITRKGYADSHFLPSRKVISISLRNIILRTEAIPNNTQNMVILKTLPNIKLCIYGRFLISLDRREYRTDLIADPSVEFARSTSVNALT